MLNMVIAIMGDTYERVMENTDLNRIKMKLNLMMRNLKKMITKTRKKSLRRWRPAQSQKKT